MASTVMTISVAGADVYRTFVPDIERSVALFTLLPRRVILGYWVADQRASRNLQDVLIEVLPGIIKIVHNKSWKSVSSAYPTVMRHKFGIGAR